MRSTPDPSLALVAIGGTDTDTVVSLANPAIVELGRMERETVRFAINDSTERQAEFQIDQ